MHESLQRFQFVFLLEFLPSFSSDGVSEMQGIEDPVQAQLLEQHMVEHKLAYKMGKPFQLAAEDFAMTCLEAHTLGTGLKRTSVAAYSLRRASDRRRVGFDLRGFVLFTRHWLRKEIMELCTAMRSSTYNFTPCPSETLDDK